MNLSIFLHVRRNIKQYRKCRFYQELHVLITKVNKFGLDVGEMGLFLVSASVYHFFAQLLYSLNFWKKFIFWMTGNVDKACPVQTACGVLTTQNYSHTQIMPLQCAPCISAFFSSPVLMQGQSAQCKEYLQSGLPYGKTAWTAPNSAIKDASKSFNLKIIIIIINLHEDDGAL